jgi:hypothetical protein
MKERFLALFVISLLAISTAFAAGGPGEPQGIHEPGTGIENPELKEAEQGTGQGVQANTETATQNAGEETQIQTQNQQAMQIAPPEMPAETQARKGQGNYMNSNGEEMQLRNENGQKLKVGNVEAQSSLEITPEQTQEKTQLKAKLSNGKNAEIKVMPNTASERAIERLQLKNCALENGCTIELKEVGAGEQARAAYEVKAQKDAKVLGMFKTRMQVQAQIDAETGEVIKTKKAWWAFLATE